jgi:hypothetical protein
LGVIDFGQCFPEAARYERPATAIDSAQCVIRGPVLACPKIWVRAVLMLGPSLASIYQLDDDAQALSEGAICAATGAIRPW